MAFKLIELTPIPTKEGEIIPRVSEQTIQPYKEEIAILIIRGLYTKIDNSETLYNELKTSTNEGRLYLYTGQSMISAEIRYINNAFYLATENTTYKIYVPVDFTESGSLYISPSITEESYDVTLYSNVNVTAIHQGTVGDIETKETLIESESSPLYQIDISLKTSEGYIDTLTRTTTVNISPDLVIPQGATIEITPNIAEQTIEVLSKRTAEIAPIYKTATSIEELESYLKEENLGKMYKYIGSSTTDYIQNSLCIVVDNTETTE